MKLHKYFTTKPLHGEKNIAGFPLLAVRHSQLNISGVKTI